MLLNIMYVFQILICCMLILLVVTADKEEGGLGSAIGGGGGSKGRFKPGYEERMDNLTKYFAWAFMICALIIASLAE